MQLPYKKKSRSTLKRSSVDCQLKFNEREGKFSDYEEFKCLKLKNKVFASASYVTECFKENNSANYAADGSENVASNDNYSIAIIDS